MITRERDVDATGWLLRAGVMLAFLAFGWDKFDSRPQSMWVPLFARIGFGQWFRYATGVIEIVGGILFLFPRTCRLGMVLLVCTMLGAIAAHVTVLHDPFSSIVPLAIIAAVVGVALRVPEGRWMARRNSRS